MHKQSTPKNNRTGGFRVKLLTWILLVTMLAQSLALCCSAAVAGISDLLGIKPKPGTVTSGIARFDSDETIAALKKDLLKTINQDLLMKVEDYELTGEVQVILSFSDDSLISSFSSSMADSAMTFAEFRETSAAKKVADHLSRNQETVLTVLEEKGLISNVKYRYNHILDGAFVTTTYEKLDALCAAEGVGRVMIANTYKEAVAVENPVNVYDTGIFNSSDVSYTGEKTIVAILDTGCDYTHTAFTTHQVVDPLYDRDKIEAKLKDTKAYSYDGMLEAREVYYGNLTGNKIAFGYDYADKDPDIMPFDSEHGTHVAGIIGGKDDTITGVAIDAQLAIMKVFSDYEEGANDGDILAALEDSVILGVDAINMSLGTSSGFTREVDDDYKNQIYDSIEDAGISLIVAASNDYSSAYGSEFGNTNKTSNPDSATVGAPSTYKAALSVASINGNKDKYMLANGSLEVFYRESVNQSAKEYNFFEMLGITAERGAVEFDYVTIPGYGMAINYAGVDMNGKIALVKRGDISFEEKVQFAAEAGAIAVIVYNNVHGDIAMTIGNDAKIPAVSISKDDGERLAAQATGKMVFDVNNQAGPFMSDFSSWGPNPDLSLKPEITAHGGNILSSVPGGGYEKVSGTSMAAPNMCGIVILIRQYVKEKYPEYTATQVRDLVNQLCMSTATIAKDKNGNPYSPRKQGAGIADILKATTTKAYLFVEGIGKTKLELGDDASRTGVYSMTVSLKNISAETVSYRVGNVAMTESLSVSDPEYVAEMGYLLSHASEYKVENGTFENGIVSVAAGQTAKVTLKITLSAADKSYLNANFKNGMYVEGFVTFDNVEENGVDLNAPFLAFYGDWSEAPIFDLDYYEVETEAHNDAIDNDDKIKADYYATTPAGSYYYDYMLPLGSYVYNINKDLYSPIPATEEKAAVSYYADCINGIYGVFAGLLRGAKELNISIVDTSTGKEVWSETEYNCYKSHFNGSPYPYVASIELPMVNYKTGEVFGYNNTRYEVTLSAKLDWDGNRNSNDTYSFSFYIDYEAPTIVEAEFRTEYDKSKKENRYYVDLMVYDNHYAMSVRPIVAYDFINEKGEIEKTYASLMDDPIPVYQEGRGTTTKVAVEITDFIDRIADSAMPEGITFYIEDYALNGGVCYVPFPGTEKEDGLDFESPTLDMDIHETVNLAAYLKSENSELKLEADYLKNLTWSTSDESVIAIHNGKIEALKSGSATVSVTSDSWYTTEEGADGEKIKIPLYKTIAITVSETEVDNPDSADNVKIEGLGFTSYKTLFAFNSDIDFSEIGITDSYHYFGSNPSISFYPSEKVQLFYQLDPWNLSPDRYTLKWSSNNPKVATVDENGVVTAESEGNARITLQITVDGKTSILAARCSLVVKSEFIIENRTLVAYKGKGGDVVIPDDEGIMTIGKFAFSHFDLDNEKEVEKDENGNYDMDDKKTALGNDTVTSVVIPEGVETIEKYAFYNCEKLSNVTLPSTCKTIKEYAFYQCGILENVNFDNVKTVSDYAFYKCESLTCEDLGGVNLSGVSAIGDFAFEGCRFEEVHLTNLSRSGKGAFKDCQKLKTVELGKRTRVSEQMFENTAVERISTYSDTIPDSAFKNCKKLVSVEFLNDLTYLGAEAFNGCVKLTTVTFSGACEEIAMLAFNGCSALKSFTLPNCEVILGDGAFADSVIETLIFGENTVLESVGVGILRDVDNVRFTATSSNYYNVGADGFLYNKDGSCIVLVPTDIRLGSYTVPANVKEIADGAFSANRFLTAVTFANGSQLEKIGSSAFAACRNLKTVALPVQAIVIGDYAFYEAPSLKSINLEKVTSVGDLAFQSTVLTEVNLTSDNVSVGYGAFYLCSALRIVKLGAAAKIAEYAFLESAVQTVSIRGDGATVAEGAFSDCFNLRSFDFDKLVGKVGDYAFFGCVSLQSVDLKNATEIGEACFTECPAISFFRGDNLEVIGANAFTVAYEDSQHGASFTSVYLPKLRSIGENAFYGCLFLEEIDLSGVTEIGEGAFSICQSLTKVILSENLTELKDVVFQGCVSLTDINLENVKIFGMGVLYGVPLPENLVLSSAEKLGDMAFIEMDDTHYIKSVEAPKLTHIGEQAFAGCHNLTTFHAPLLESIGTGAFAQTAIEEFEITANLKEMGFSLFEGSENLKAFYAMVNGEKKYDATFDRVMIANGALYSVTDRGYVFVCYPSAKTDKTLEIADGTVRIDFCAALANKFVEKVVLPESIRFIGNYAFFQCDNLKTVEFNSYYAPNLEGTMGEALEITPDNVDQYPGFKDLYYFDYYYRESDMVGTPYYYSNFVGAIGTEATDDLTYIIPDACEGYDSLIYKAYFKPSTETSGITVGKYALAFIDAVRRLPEVTDRFDRKLIETAINAYNALENHADEKAMIAEDLINRFFTACKEYNVSVAENKIAHLFDMDCSEYSFELVKDAKATFDALSAEEKALVKNATVLTAKIEELANAMGKTPDFSISFGEHFPADDPVAPPTPPVDTPDEPQGLKAWVIVLIVVGSLLVAGGAAFGIVIFIRKKRAVK